MDASESSPPAAPFDWNRWSAAPLNLGATLASGQNFRWRRNAAGVWLGAINDCAAALWQAENRPDSPLYWQTFPQPDQWDIIADYLRLGVDLEALYAAWQASGPEIAEATVAFRGLRILRQPPIECFFAFQCAACNTVAKIERTVSKLAERYGQAIDLSPRHPTPDTRHPIFAFPTLAALAAADETELRADLWGYRAPRVIHLARELLRDRPAGWLESLRQIPYAQAKAELTALHGVGAKLADCICLFSLDKDEAVPVDTHIRQIATRLFLPDLCGKSLTPRIYNALADSYRDRFGPFAGWAQQYLFFNELRRSAEYRE